MSFRQYIDNNFHSKGLHRLLAFDENRDTAKLKKVAVPSSRARGATSDEDTTSVFRARYGIDGEPIKDDSEPTGKLKPDLSLIADTIDRVVTQAYTNTYIEKAYGPNGNLVKRKNAKSAPSLEIPEYDPVTRSTLNPTTPEFEPTTRNDFFLDDAEFPSLADPKRKNNQNEPVKKEAEYLRSKKKRKRVNVALSSFLNQN